MSSCPSVYTYIEKLEKSGNCDCAFKYPHVGFIKSFSIFALIFVLFVMFVPPGTILASIFGKEITGLYLFVIFVFYVVFAVHFRNDFPELFLNCADDVLVFGIGAVEEVEIGPGGVLEGLVVCCALLFHAIFVLGGTFGVKAEGTRRFLLARKKSIMPGFIV